MPEEPKRIMPSMHERKRYLAFKVISDKKIEYPELANAIWHSILNFLGELGTAEAEPWILKNVYSPEKKMGLIKCNHTDVERIRTALALVQKVNETPVIINVIGISGTIKTAQKKFFGEKDLRDF